MMSNQRIEEVIVQVLEENEEDLSDGFRFYSDDVGATLRRIAADIASCLEHTDDGLTLATLCDMVLGEDATDRSNDALVKAVGRLLRLAEEATDALLLAEAFIATTRGGGR